MPSSSTDRPLKVLSAERRAQVSNFNQACRDLQSMGIRLRCIDLAGNRLELDHEDGHRLVARRLVLGLQCRPSAGSTFYIAQFRGVALEWRTPISYVDFQTVH